MNKKIDKETLTAMMDSFWAKEEQTRLALQHDHVSLKESNLDIAKIERFLRRNYIFRYNTVKGQLELMSANGKEDFRALTERDEFSIWRAIQTDEDLEEDGVNCSISYLRGILTSEFCPLHDPFKSFLEDDLLWDGEVDYIAQLASTVKTNNDELFHRFLKSWLVATVGSMIDPDVVNHTALIFTGRQGLGKSRWIQKLVPNSLKDYYYSGPVNPYNKDTLINLSTCMIIDLDELENLNNNEVGALKELITKPHIKIRRPYGRYNEDLPRRASFAGSINDNQFLNDSTGSRRFLCFDCKEIDYMHNVDIYRVYFQAFALFKSGYKYWLDENDRKELEINNSRFQRTTVEEDLLLKHLLPAKDGDENALFYSTTEIANYISKDTQAFIVSNATIQKLGRALKKHGFSVHKKGGLQKYCVQVVTNEPSKPSAEPEKDMNR